MTADRAAVAGVAVFHSNVVVLGVLVVVVIVVINIYDYYYYYYSSFNWC